MNRKQTALKLGLPVVVSLASVFFLLILFSTIETVQASGPWYVTPGGNDSNTCVSSTTPCATINAAIDKASPGDTVYVAIGTYTSTGGNAVVTLSKNITLSGGWNVGFTSQVGTSVIDGQGAWIGIYQDTGSAGINHFTIQNGYTDFEGGGIYVQASQLSIANSRIINNAAFIGGGVLNWSGVITITNSVIEKNIGDIGGGGIYNINGTLTITNSTISENTIGISTINPSGAAIWSSDPGSRTVLNRTTISNNHARTALNPGEAVISGNWMEVLNSTISNNDGNGIMITGETSIRSSTIADNSGIGLFHESGQFELANTIIANNGGTSPRDCHSLSINVSSFIDQGYNLIRDNMDCPLNATDLENINPRLFTLIGSPATRPLMIGSPAIDAGDPAGCMDLWGNPVHIDQRGVIRSGRCDIGSFEFDPGNDPLTYISLPIVKKSPEGIYGFVTQNGGPIADVSLDLWLFDGSSWIKLATTSTSSDGYYSFTNIPGLNPGQKYIVEYFNANGTPGRLWAWDTHELTSYQSHSTVGIGNFDIADIGLRSPLSNLQVDLPYTFQWYPRPSTPTDSYEFDLYDPDDLIPFFFTDPPLGYVGNYSLNSLPTGFKPSTLYVWEIWVYSPDGGMGISYESRPVAFSNLGLSDILNLPSTRQKSAHLQDAGHKRK